MSELLHFRFKGDRNYVHGSDTFEALEALLNQDDMHVRRLTFRRFSHHQLECAFSRPGGMTIADGQAVGASGRRTEFWLLETLERVVDRYEFDESLIIKGAQVNGEVIEAESLSGYSVIEQAIALTKALNYARAPKVSGKWVFGELCLNQDLPTHASHYCIRQTALLANRFSVQEIRLDGKLIGELRFIVGKP
jgi:hypothetical protein